MNQRHEPAAAMAGMGARSSATTKLVLVDPIPFRGGSKVATEAMLEALSDRMPAMEHHVLTADHGSWPACRHHNLRVPALLRGRESGIGYLLKQGWQTLMILWLIWRLGEVRGLLAASGPGVDLCCYWAARFAGIPVVQLIHGPVGGSRLSARALWRASQVFYLEAARPSLLALMAHLGQQDIPVHWQPFINGLREADWPTATSGGTGILWAASLLKWKGLETMLASAICNPGTYCNLAANLGQICPIPAGMRTPVILTRSGPTAASSSPPVIRSPLASPSWRPWPPACAW